MLTIGMTNLIFGVGIGLFFILTLWILALIVFVISLRIEKKVGVIFILIVSIITTILIALPKASYESHNTGKKIYDHLFIWRILLLIILIISSIIGSIGYIKLAIAFCVTPIQITTWIS